MLAIPPSHSDDRTRIQMDQSFTTSLSSLATWKRGLN